MQTTEDHQLSPPPARTANVSALIAAFPQAKAVQLPPLNQAVGRHWFTDIGLADSKMSREHLRFSNIQGVLSVADIGSKNGSWLNGQRLYPNQPAPLAEGAVLRIGGTLFVYRSSLQPGDLPTPWAPAPRLGGPQGLVGPYGLRGLVAKIAHLRRRNPRNILIQGETGSGKELLSRAIAQTLRPGRPYVAINCAGIPAGVFESQLFGHTAGAFSGAGKGSPGVFEQHEGGGVFLDEFGELPLETQAKLLRLLDNREVFPVGGNKAKTVDVLVTAATNRNLASMVEAGYFRRDLHARFAGNEIHLPPLRARVEDLFAIANAIMLPSSEAAYDPSQVEVEAVELLMLHPWPANIRQLYGVLQEASMEVPLPALRTHAVAEVLKAQAAPSSMSISSSGGAPASSTPLTPEAVRQALEYCGGNQTQAAQYLRVSRGKLLRFLDKHPQS